MNLEDRLLGRRFTFTLTEAPDVTVVGYDEAAGVVRLHCLGNGRATLPLKEFLQAYHDGAVMESDQPPFVYEHEGRFARLRRERAERRALRTSGPIGVMGPNKTVITHAQLLKGRK